MIQHYLSTSFRHFRRHKLTAGINVVCLAIGVACFAAAVGAVTWLSEADRHFARADRIFVVGEGMDSPVKFAPMPASSWTVGRHLAADLERAEAVARLRVDALATAVAELRGRARLALGARARLPLAWNDLQRDVETVVLVPGEPDRPGAAAAERPDWAVATEDQLAGGEGDGRSLHLLPRFGHASSMSFTGRTKGYSDPGEMCLQTHD